MQTSFNWINENPTELMYGIILGINGEKPQMNTLPKTSMFNIHNMSYEHMFNFVFLLLPSCKTHKGLVSIYLSATSRVVANA